MFSCRNIFSSKCLFSRHLASRLCLKKLTTTSTQPLSWVSFDSMTQQQSQPRHPFKITRRDLSSTSSWNRSEVVLYEKSAGHVRIAKYGLGFSCFHSLYWAWYAIDFVPTVNAAQMSELHVDPVFPMIGVCFATIVQAIFTGYPLRLVSKISWRPEARECWVYTHSLPFIQPAAKPSVSKVGDVRLDAASVEARKIVQLGELESFRGMLSIGKPGQWPPYMLDIRNPYEVREPEILMELLLQPERMDKDYSHVPGSTRPKKRQFGSKRPSRRKRSQ